MRDHDTDSLMCWCGPRYYVACHDCTRGCWKCDKGRIELDFDEARGLEREPVIIVHDYSGKS